ncbi:MULTISPECIES: bile acid:sodium symporter family protein [unclassified Spirosoma]|uniref:bile acid:sodium symporter family protein n=1 Tax=unclassified Spirosoma TaxID=2621999 RepID=UPI000962FC29|nr:MULTISPECIES: bile acid:sodium symporter family protein [unclassified Spirosoma]MBN8826971.1 bile acid:sodium symporter family protein [Spirosoma sp.]OJW75141.1 MAG: bile acid:sodium symporter [Spirosoma sp. 48-14]
MKAETNDRSSYRNLIFTALLILFVGLAFAFPAPFVSIGGFPLKKLIVPLLQIIMLGMGTTMSIKDFEGVIQQPKAVFIGVVCHFIIMPLLGYTLANTFSFPPEIAAGVVLIGCSPSGLASNVMCFIAKANVPLSITVTTISTLLAPFVMPALMKFLAGQFIEISFLKMMVEIMQIVILPIVVGLILNRVFHKSSVMLNRVMPMLSMGGIILIVAIIAAAGRDSLLTVGWTLALCVLIHNLCGFILGYGTARLFGMDEQSCRTVAIEVGLQNGGLASGIAVQMGKVATVGLAPALFGPIMNTNGSLLATYWSQHPPKDVPTTEPASARQVS